jgi:hypothetical protein
MHHLIPKSMGGTDDLMIPLCFKCHRKAHGLKANVNHSELTKAGLQRAKERGVKLGFSDPKRKEIAKLAGAKGAASSSQARKDRAKEYLESFGVNVLMWRQNGMSLRKIARKLEYLDVETPRGNKKWEAAQVKNLVNGLLEIRSE